MYWLALDGYAKLLGNDHEETKDCARNLAIFLEGRLRKKDLRKVLDDYPHLKKD